MLVSGPTANSWQKAIETIPDKDEINKRLQSIGRLLPHGMSTADCFRTMSEEEHLFFLSIAQNGQVQVHHHFAVLGGTVSSGIPKIFTALSGFGFTAMPIEFGSGDDALADVERVIPAWAHLVGSNNDEDLFKNIKPQEDNAEQLEGKNIIPIPPAFLVEVFIDLPERDLASTALPSCQYSRA